MPSVIFFISLYILSMELCLNWFISIYVGNNNIHGMMYVYICDYENERNVLWEESQWEILYLSKSWEMFDRDFNKQVFW